MGEVAISSEEKRRAGAVFPRAGGLALLVRAGEVAVFLREKAEGWRSQNRRTGADFRRTGGRHLVLEKKRARAVFVGEQQEDWRGFVWRTGAVAFFLFVEEDWPCFPSKHSTQREISASDNQ